MVKDMLSTAFDIVYIACFDTNILCLDLNVMIMIHSIVSLTGFFKHSNKLPFIDRLYNATIQKNVINEYSYFLNECGDLVELYLLSSII